MIEEKLHQSTGSDVQTSITHPSPPLDVHSDSTTTHSHAQSSASPDRSSTPSTIHEDELRDEDEKDVELAQATSTAQSVRPPPVRVPTAERGGLFARFCILAEVEEPKHYSRKTKWFITFIIALAAVTASLGSTIILREPLSQSCYSFAYVLVSVTC